MWQIECTAGTLNAGMTIKKIIKKFNWHLKKMPCQLVNIKKFIQSILTK